MSGFYIGVDGKARKVKGGYIGVDGKARKIKKGYIGVDGVAQLCWTAFEADPVFANNSWENIALACQLNAVPDSWVVGDQKTMTIGGTDYAIDIIGKNHDDYADGSGKAPLTFQLHGTYSQVSSMGSAAAQNGGWAVSLARTNLLPKVLELISSDIQNNIKEVTKYTSISCGNTTIGTTNDKLFLLSEVEIFGDTTWSVSGEGTLYEYYSKGGKTSRIKKNPSNATVAWWQRSPSTTGNCFCHVDVDGTKSSHPATYNYDISFAFCF